MKTRRRQDLVGAWGGNGHPIWHRDTATARRVRHDTDATHTRVLMASLVQPCLSSRRGQKTATREPDTTLLYPSGMENLRWPLQHNCRLLVRPLLPADRPRDLQLR